MSFSINTNIASLEAQNYLTADKHFQTQTINEVTSGLRIVNSGDDAAGLAIANGLRSDQAVLTQGIQNANDGLASLQTIDGGVNNISQLLDRASTLATESASSTFTGDRTVLNQEFQSVLSEINRQAQVIGLNSGGQFAQNLTIFIGGGKASSSTSAISNGSVSVDLSNSAIDTQALGLSGYAVAGKSSVNIGPGAGATSVQNILADTSNQQSEAQPGFAEFYFTGPGFASSSGSARIAVAVNLNGVTDANTLAAAIDSAIAATGNGPSQEATAFKNAGVKASVFTDPAGATHLQFTSSNSAFQVEAGDATANALLGNIASGSSGQPVTTATAATGTAVTAATAAETVKLRITNGVTPQTVSVNINNADTPNQILEDVNDGLSGTGATASLDTNGNLIFSSGEGQSLQVQASGDSNNFLGLGTFQTDAGGNFSYTSIAAPAGQQASSTQNFQIAVGNQVVNLGEIDAGAGEANSLTNLNTAFQGNAVLRAANLQAIDDGTGNIEIVSGNGTQFRLNTFAGSGAASFGFPDGVDSAATATLTATSQNGADSPSLDSGGTSTSGFLNFNPVSINGTAQTITLSGADNAGSTHSININLNSGNAGNIDAAINAINSALLQSDDSTLGQVVAVKDQSNGKDGIRFISSLPDFNLSLGTTATGTTAGNVQGIYAGTPAVPTQGGPVITATPFGAGSTVDISSAGNAENAVTALSNAVTALGRAQAAVGKGENLFNYAIQLAQSQVTNEAAAESGIRDANMAAEASNLSKAQILVQAGTAALAQANSAPQAILTLLRQ
ncbi:MAG: flagellin [Ignavibacteriota bacterium]